MRTIWKMSSAEPAANYPAEPSTSARGGLHPVQAAGAEPDFMVDDADDGFEWNFAQPPERAPDPLSIAAAPGSDPDTSLDLSHESEEPAANASEEPAQPTELPQMDEAAGVDAEQPERDEPPTEAEAEAAPAEPPVLAERLVVVERTRPGGKPPSWRWPAVMAIVVVAVVALLFIIREQMDAPRPAAEPVFAGDEPLEPDAGFPASPVDAPEAVAPLPQVHAAPAPVPAAATTAAHSAPPKQKAAQASAPVPAAATAPTRSAPPKQKAVQTPAPVPAAATAPARSVPLKQKPAQARAPVPAVPRSAPPKQKAAQTPAPKKHQRPPRRAKAQRPAAAPADAISCILPGGQEVQASYPSCRSRGGVIYR